jgi:hypothetical protein
MLRCRVDPEEDQDRDQFLRVLITAAPHLTVSKSAIETRTRHTRSDNRVLLCLGETGENVLRSGSDESGTVAQFSAVE